MKSSADRRLMVVPFQAVRCGGRLLLARGDREEIWPVPGRADRLLQSFNRPLTLAQGCEEWCAARKLEAAQREEVARILDEAVRRGFLVPEGAVAERLSGGGKQGEARRLARVLIPSGGRGEVCARTCGTILSNLKHYGREVPVTVVETPGLAGMTGMDYAEALAAEGRRQGRKIGHVSPAGTRRLIAALARESGVDEWLLTAAMTDALAPGLGQAFGAGRNVIQMVQPEGCYLSFDDDVQCRGWVTEHGGGWRVDTGDGDAEIDLLPEGESWRHPEDRMGPDLDELGTRWLGQSAGACLAQGGVQEIELRQEWLWSRLQGDRGRVRYVYPGTIGDSGNRSKMSLLGASCGQTPWLLGDAGRLRAALSSRIFRRIYRRKCVGAFHFISGRCNWVDHEEALPPHFPIGRGEDFLMGRLLPHLDARALAVYVPYAFLHLPVPDRPPYPGLREHAPNWYYCHWFGHYLVATVPRMAGAYGHLGVEEAIRRTGRDLVLAMQGGRRGFAEYAVETGRNLVAHQIQRIGRLLEEAPRLDEEVRSDLEWLISRWEEALLNPDQLFPADFAQWVPGANWETMREWFLLYGRMMEVWPEVRRAARALAWQGGDWIEMRG